MMIKFSTSLIVMTLGGAAMAADPCEDVLMHTKCTYQGDARIWKKSNLSLEACQVACEADATCMYYSHQEIGEHAGDCMACKGNEDIHTDPHQDFITYNRECKNWATGEEVEAIVAEEEGLVPADFGDCPTMYQDHKCPWQHEDRTHRIEGLTIDECYDACVIDPECLHWSYSREGDASGQFVNVCMGCNATVNKHVHDGFNLYSMCEDGRKIALERRSALLGGGGGYGDPHLKTWKGDVYDFHGECDMVLVHDHDFANDLGLDFHIRTTIRSDWSFISEAVVKIGKDVLEVHGGGTFFYNGVSSDDSLLPEDATLGGYAITKKDHSSGTRTRIMFTVNLGEKGHIQIKVYNEFLAAYVLEANPGEFGNSVGLMGRFSDGVKVARDGVTEIKDNVSFGKEWQVQKGRDPIIFQTAKGPQFPQTCIMPDPVQKASLRRRRMDEIGITWEQAEAACGSWDVDARESCIYDVLSTGDLNMADAGAF